MNYSESLDWLYSLRQFGIKLGLDNTTKLLFALDHPQDRFESILIGGTNGKGSVGAMIQSILSVSGYRTGLYTSPHLARLEERIRIGYDEISSGQLAQSLSRIRSVVEKLLDHKVLSHHPTFFEILTASCFEMFARQKVDIAVVEVGMGGRFDATNILYPVLSVITNIEKDHTEYLGKTLNRIAFEKCGIIRENGFLITGRVKHSPLEMIKKISREKRSFLVDAWRDSEFSLNNDRTVTLITPSFQYEKLNLPLPGKHQIENMTVAVRASEILAEMGFNIIPKTISRGIEKMKWEGRIEWVRSKPPIILDGAHNVSAMRALSKYLSRLRKENYEVRIIFGAMQDKDIDGMLRVLSPAVDSIYLTTLDMERAASLDHLYNASLNHHRVVRKCQNLREALRASSKKTSSKVISIKNKKSLQKPVICVCGSLFLVGAFKSLRAKQKEKRNR